MIGRAALIGAAALLAAAPAWGQEPPGLSETEQAAPALPRILPPRERADLENRILRERLDT
ncbi:hypothetical protein NL533_36205, partial [Klebsiella pneumoniae]|nr:hypothetical protein [Klebsiella pneumoniae]